MVTTQLDVNMSEGIEAQPKTRKTSLVTGGKWRLVYVRQTAISVCTQARFSR